MNHSQRIGNIIIGKFFVYFRNIILKRVKNGEFFNVL